MTSVPDEHAGRLQPAAATAGPLASPGYWLHHAALAWRRELGVRLRPHDLTPTQFDVLGALSWQSRGGEVTQQMIADFAGIDRMMTSKVMQTLERRGLVERSAHPDDARVLQVRLTELGRSMVTQATAEARALDRDLFAAQEESLPLRISLSDVLDRVRSARR